MTRCDDVRRNPVRLFFCWAGGSKDVKRWSHFFSLSRFCSVLAFAPVRFLMIGRMESDRASKTVVRPLQSGHSYADEADPIAKGVGRGYFDGDNKRTASCSRPVIKRFPTIRLSLSLSVAGHIKRKEKHLGYAQKYGNTRLSGFGGRRSVWRLPHIERSVTGEAAEDLGAKRTVLASRPDCVRPLLLSQHRHTTGNRFSLLT